MVQICCDSLDATMTQVNLKHDPRQKKGKTLISIQEIA